MLVVKPLNGILHSGYVPAAIANELDASRVKYIQIKLPTEPGNCVLRAKEANLLKSIGVPTPFNNSRFHLQN